MNLKNQLKIIYNHLIFSNVLQIYNQHIVNFIAANLSTVLISTDS